MRYGMHGLGADLAKSGMEMAKLGGSALVGAGIAKAVVSGINGIKKGDAPAAGATDNREAMFPKWFAPLAPIAVGIAVHNYGKARFPMAAPGVAAGMVAVGIGGLVGALFVDPKKLKGGAEADPKSASQMISDYVPFAGLGGDVYDYSLMGLGEIGPGSVDAYMRLGGSPFTASMARGTSIMQPGAPVQIQTLRGLAGAPTQAQVISTTPSMSAALVA